MKVIASFRRWKNPHKVSRSVLLALFLCVQSISNNLTLILSIFAGHLPFILHVLKPSILDISVEQLLIFFKSGICLPCI